jgi:hypothetical protein
MFRRATCQRTWPETGCETYHWLEIAPDSWVGTNRLCESEDEAKEMQNQCGYGERQTGKLAITATLGWIRLTADPDTVEVFDPV